MSAYSFWHKHTGAVHPVVLKTSFGGKVCEEVVRLNTPKDHMPIESELDPRKHRVNPETGAVEDLPAVTP